jgi:type I restriction-modification system DNA methylase subunit
MSQREVSAVNLWRAFATSFVVTQAGKPKTWEEYTAGLGYSDEQKVVQPTAFPAFAEQCLGWSLQLNLAPEELGVEGKPDFTPADSVTHPFVFETKSTKELVKLEGFDEQVERYLTEGKPRIKAVLLTNLVGARVFVLDDANKLSLKYEVNLRSLLTGPVESAAKRSDARKLADLFDDFRRQELTPEQKIDRVRKAPEWNPIVEVTSSNWILRRIDRIVAALTTDVLQQIKEGALQDQTRTNAEERTLIVTELRLLATRLGEGDADVSQLDTFVEASDASLLGKALQQFAAHVAYYAATRLMLVRVWEDLELLEPMLHDGGFDKQMDRFSGVLNDVIDYSFTKAKVRYRALFDQRNGYTWYVPALPTYIDVIYELANTYLGAIQSDVLGQVYERMLERIDRKLLGVYYTPRDIIALIWDLIGFEAIADEAETDGREPRVLDIATGSGGFLVDVARRLRERVQQQRKDGAQIQLQAWINDVASGLNGVELNRFSAYLAELNLLVQFGQVIAEDSHLRLPPMGVIAGDTLSLHDPVTPPGNWESVELPPDLLVDSADQRDRARRIKVASQADFLMDVACGNPPYIGEKTAAEVLARTRREYPYWDSFVGQHMDYLYWFLILGVSKLRAGGRFGFITTEYWLRAEGAKPLRGYLASRCHVDRIVLFRDFRLFPDAPGQHSMIVTGTRIAPADATMMKLPAITAHKPRVSIYNGGPVAESTRAAVLDFIRKGTRGANVQSFDAQRSPNTIGSKSWADVVLTRSQLKQRDHLTTGDQITLDVSEGVITTANNLTAKTEELLSAKDLATVGGSGSKAGIQQLTVEEVAGLGQLTKVERAAIRRQLNTKDVYPYAAVVPDNAPSIIYLPKQASEIDSSLTDEQVRTSTPFPDETPNIEKHLNRFRALLEAKSRGWNERRPWWTLHRARQEIVGDAERATRGWANYCVLARWGVGGTLCVGRAPAGTSPASGLHVLRPQDDVVPAGYLAALYNSTLYQEIAESLPPGQLRKAELQSTSRGLPDGFG